MAMIETNAQYFARREAGFARIAAKVETANAAHRSTLAQAAALPWRERAAIRVAAMATVQAAIADAYAIERAARFI